MNNITQLEKIVNNFLELLGYGPNDKVCLRGFSLSNEAKKASYSRSKINYKTLQQWNSNGFGIYVVVNGGGQTDREVKQCFAIFYEHDNLSKAEQKELWRELGLPEPTMQIDTGGKSIHSYWVFEQPIDKENWKVLQADLLEFADADRSIKNPSRVMRLPGFIHQETGNLAEIISQSGKRYSYEDLRQAIPIQQTQTLDLSTPTVTHLDAVPLETCLTRDDRALINSGESEGKRNNSGAKLARNLIGTAKRLDYLGYSYRGDPYQLFDSYCSRCTPPIGNKEAQQIWKSAEKDNPTATLTDDALENCVKAWRRQHNRQLTKTSTYQSSTKAQVQPIKKTNPVQTWEDIKVYEAIVSLTQERPKKSKLARELKALSNKSKWDVKSLREIYEQTVEEQDKDAELEDDIEEFKQILSANEDLPCEKILPIELHPILKYAKNLGANPEPCLLACF